MAFQQIGLEQDFDRVTLQTICGQQIKIEFAGWYHSASGPDFRAGGGAHRALTETELLFSTPIGKFGGNTLF